MCVFVGFSLLISVRLFAFTAHPEEVTERESEKERKEWRRTSEPTERDRKQMEWKEKQDPWQRERGTN